MRGKFIIFLLILTLLLGIVGFWYYQKNIYSKGNLKLEIIGPSQCQLLEEATWTVRYKNNGNIVLEEPKLTFEYPAYSLVAQEKLREQITLEDIYPGQEKTYQFKGRLIGGKGDIKAAKANLSYRPKNLKSFYESQTSFSCVVESVPLSFDIDIPSKVEAGREINFSLNYFSSLDFPLSNLRARLEYPSNFEFLKSRPVGLEQGEWEIGILNKAEGGRIDIKGKLSGEMEEQKTFRAQLGTWQNNEFVLLREAVKAVRITKPLLSVFQRLNGKENYVANFGDWLHYEIFFRNIGEEPFRYLFLISKLESDIFDFSALKTEGGQFNREEKSIIWDWRENPELQFLDRGEEGKVEFWLKLKDVDALAEAKKNSVLLNQVIIGEVKEQFSTKVQSKLDLVQRGFFEDDIFGNQGAIPPQVGQETTYTIMWLVKNCCGAVKNVKIKAVLPPEVKLTGKVFPEDLSLTFDPDSREVVWQVGDLAGSRPLGAEQQSAAFQISFVPTAAQQGKIAVIVDEARISGEDGWTGEIVEGTAKAIDTSLQDDKTVGEGKGRVE